MPINDVQQSSNAPAEQETPVLDPQQPEEPRDPDPGDNTPENGSEAPEAAPGDQADDRDGKEAARYRRKLRDTEAERDALAERIETLQRREIERLASRIVKQGAAVWLAGDTVEAFLDEDGDIDPDKVAEVARRMRTLYAVAGATKLLHVPREGGNPAPATTAYAPVDVVMGRNKQ